MTIRESVLPIRFVIILNTFSYKLLLVTPKNTEGGEIYGNHKIRA